MNTPIIGPLGLSLLSLAPFLAGCCRGPGCGDAKSEQAATVSVSLTALTQIENLQDVTLEFSPLYLWVEDPALGEWNYRVFTDSKGENRISNSAEDRPSDCDGAYVVTRDEEAPWEYRYVRSGSDAFECSWVPHSWLRLVDSPAVNPLPTVYIARNYALPSEATKSIVQTVWFSPYGTRAAVRGAFLHLSDGRECPVRVPHIAEEWPVVPSFSIGNGNFWLIKIAVDFEGTVIDPALCTDGYDVRVNVRSVTAEQMQGPIN